jgi:hypothetical protein
MKNRNSYFTEDIKAVQWCWDKGIKVFPIVAKNQKTSYKEVPKVKINIQKGSRNQLGNFEYRQNKELYDKIQELYNNMFEKRNL